MTACLVCGEDIRPVGYGMWGHVANPGPRHHYARPASGPRTPQERTARSEQSFDFTGSRRTFWGRVQPGDACWLWTGEISRGGYGRLEASGRHVQAHRRAYELAVGPIPDGLLVCHHCDNPPCVRPDHLFLGTVRDNALDMVAKGRAPSGDRSGSRLHPERVVRGEAHPRSKLSATAVRDIRTAVRAGAVKAELARQFGVSDTAIGHAASGRTWGHVA